MAEPNNIQYHADVVIAPSKRYEWEPKEDISAYELSILLPVLVNPTVYSGHHLQEFLETLPECARRHLREIA